MKEEWPKFNKRNVLEQQVKFIIQVNGKVRDIVNIEAGISQQEAINIARKSKKVNKFIQGKSPKKIISIQNKILNLVI